MWAKVVKKTSVKIVNELDEAFAHNKNFLIPQDPTAGLVLSQGPIVLHLALFICGFFAEKANGTKCKATWDEKPFEFDPN